jgi:hypothetical protein
MKRQIRLFQLLLGCWLFGTLGGVTIQGMAYPLPPEAS